MIFFPTIASTEQAVGPSYLVDTIGTPTDVLQAVSYRGRPTVKHSRRIFVKILRKSCIRFQITGFQVSEINRMTKRKVRASSPELYNRHAAKWWQQFELVEFFCISMATGVLQTFLFIIFFFVFLFRQFRNLWIGLVDWPCRRLGLFERSWRGWGRRTNGQLIVHLHNVITDRITWTQSRTGFA